MIPYPQTFYLVGIRGVAMTALAQVLVDAGHTVFGSDVAATFVTEPQLRRLKIDVGAFTDQIPSEVDQVIYTAAHRASLHPQVQAAQNRGIPTYSHAEALGEWFNQKKGVAICGVGGKSTISAMLSWILEQANVRPSYAVGVGDIIGLNKTGKWDENGEDFVAEADEYSTDPSAVQLGATLVPRFTYLKPTITVASTISFDHPDVYKNEAHTRAVFIDWFKHIPDGGILISADTNRPWLQNELPNLQILWYGQSAESDFILTDSPKIQDGMSVAVIRAAGNSHTLALQVPGSYNMLNALAAISAATQMEISVEESINHLATFRSTKRRFEHVGAFQGVQCYDDYAHHPREIAVVLEAAKQWFATKRVLVAFQPHTYSRTKALFSDFVTSLSLAPELVLLDIFSSARESEDPTVSSDLLCAAIRAKNPATTVKNLHTVNELASYCREQLHEGDILLTLGAGDIYQVHDLLKETHE